MLARARAWLQELARSLWAALAGAFAEPPPPRTRTVRVWPFPRTDAATARDVALTASLYLITGVALFDLNDAAGRPYRAQSLHLITAVSTLPILARERYPLATWRWSLLALLWAAQSVDALLAPPAFPLVPGQVIAYLLVLYPIGLRGDRRVAVGAWVAGLLAVWADGALSTAGQPLPAATSSVLWPIHLALAAVLTAAPLVLAQNVRARRQAQDRLTEEEGRTQRERDQRAVLQERGRIARELHDVVAHHMSVIAIQAEAAPLRAGDRADLLRSDLAEIRATALEALVEMRRILGVLREPDDAPVTAPQPGLRQLGDLVERASAGGLRVRTALHGDTADLPPAVALSAYRIVQESLSNAMRHAPGSEVDVEVVRADDRVELAVVSGPPAAGEHGPLPGGTGQGLVGMRERAAMLGGTLIAEPTAAGGFAVRAVLPLPRQEAPA